LLSVFLLSVGITVVAGDALHSVYKWVISAIFPLSISIALGMRYNGTGGKTQDGTERDMRLKEVNSGYAMLMGGSKGSDPKVGFLVASSLQGVLHKAVIEINDGGTVAAGVTPVTMGITSVLGRFTFTGNRPFFFVICDNLANSLLFMWAVVEPE